MTIPALMPVYPRCDVEPVRGDGAYLFDAHGRRWLDFASGVAVNALGHGHPHLVQAICAQAARLMHTSNLYKVPAQQKLAERLVDLTFADTVFFTNSGAESVECAIKTCRRHHQAGGDARRRRILTFRQAFHGRTLATISATDQEKLRAGFEPLLDGFTVLPFNDLDAVRRAMAPDVAGVLLEPIQGEGGLRPATAEFAHGLRRLCDEHGALLIFDEVQTGVGRTGSLFFYEQLGVAPDIMAVAKGIGGGFPVGACLATERAASGMTFGTHGSTYGGNPLAMAACQAVLDVVTGPGFLEHVTRISGELRTALEAVAREHADLIDHVRGAGLMLGLKLKADSRAFVDHARRAGLLTVAAGDNVVRVLPPLIIDESHVRECAHMLSEAARSFPQSRAA